MPYPLLKTLTETKSLLDLSVNQALVKEIQTLLKEGDFYTGTVDGILGKDTIIAFKAFKSTAYLEFLDCLGTSTAKALLELGGQDKHPIPQEATEPLLTISKGKSIRLPGGEVVYCGESIANCPNFKWGEATKNGARIPLNKEVVQNIIKVAEYMELVKAVFDGRVITVTSWYRPPDVNRQQGGVAGSRHILGDAVDFLVQGIPPLDVYRRLNNWHGARGGLGQSSTFSHLDRRGYCARFTYG